MSMRIKVLRDPIYLGNSGGAQLKEVVVYPRDAIFEIV